MEDDKDNEQYNTYTQHTPRKEKGTFLILDDLSVFFYVIVKQIGSTFVGKLLHAAQAYKFIILLRFRFLVFFISKKSWSNILKNQQQTTTNKSNNKMIRKEKIS